MTIPFWLADIRKHVTFRNITFIRVSDCLGGVTSMEEDWKEQSTGNMITVHVSARRQLVT